MSVCYKASIPFLVLFYSLLSRMVTGRKFSKLACGLYNISIISSVFGTGKSWGFGSKMSSQLE